MKTIIVDIDGTIADAEHRMHYIKGEQRFWKQFFMACIDDKPIQNMIDLVVNLKRYYKIIFITGRSDECRTLTIQWLCRYHLWDGGDILMRKQGDHRPDTVVKSELLDEYQKRCPGDQIVFALEDRTRVVEMWRARGIPCLQVAEGAF